MEETLDESGVVTVIQARMNARRLPGKPLLPLGDTIVLDQVIRRVRAARFGQRLIVATSDDESDQPLRAWCAENEIPCYAGNRHDLLDRTIRAAETLGATVVVRCFASCPLLDPKMLDACARYALDSGMDYIVVARLPEGVTSEAVPMRVLRLTDEMTADPMHREEVTSFACAHLELFERAFLPPPMRLARQDARLILETEDDYVILKRLYTEVAPGPDGLLRVEDAIAFLDTHALHRPRGHFATLTAQAA